MIDAQLRQCDALLEAGKIEDAGPRLRALLNKAPNDPRVLWSLAYCYMKAESWGLAYALLKRAIDIQPGEPKLWSNLAASALSMASSANNENLLDEAERLLNKVVKRSPKLHQAYEHLALIATHRCQPQRAIDLCNQALAHNETPQCRETLGYAQMMLGQWRDGLRNYDCSVGSAKVRMPEPFGDEPYWDGTDNIRLFVRGEQGIGDEISYASCIPDAVKHGNQVTYECDKRLEGLMRRSLQGVVVHGTRFAERNWTGEFDFHCLSGSLAREYRQSAESFSRKAFLVPDPERRLQWRALLDTLPGKKVGIAWSGGLPNTFSGRRSFELEKLLPILKTPGITWVSLQYKDAQEGIEAVAKKGVKIHHWERAVGKGVDYDETAALVAELDCVVSVCTAVVHLCGAIGQKCLVLVPSKPRWWYGLQGRDHTWYESLELYRQTDKWPVERVAERLKELC